ncbi:16S rRNA (cytidine(1402)-2'-O)-methyltransferase [Falsirhodobacter halotolerans]|uniref:16S rRNA (cytidine(1402)-2'-O)-methyltransferase n=1 Tax=Falsirhodobacter halotolerans TaxID=1146892 RepID=UPI001FD0E2F5|nr:16S rRNA (cytidine(1402)-2'-O)-methyltransferase [Falsirhodobacter halotolerans]MCJ8138685.1 16S rRNA (cytidine(1402)-2'-O)-methyltransferase [Falsirhodobacter halotolerans]
MATLAHGLYFVATPIGAARDITLRALDILREADVLAAEDTRTLRHLMEIHGVALNGRPLVAYHDHNGGQATPRLIRALEEGKTVAYASEAGTPLVSDPGFELGREAIAAGLPVLTAPGPSAVIAALTVAGLPSDRFMFAGFLPATRSARQRVLRELAGVPATLIFYESPRRLAASLADMADVLGPRDAAVCRELTKRFEEVVRDPLPDLAATFADRDVKGEIVVLVDRGTPEVATEADVETALRAALETASVKDAAAQVAARLGLPKRDVYQMALKL